MQRFIKYKSGEKFLQNVLRALQSVGWITGNWFVKLLRIYKIYRQFKHKKCKKGKKLFSIVGFNAK